VRIGLVCPYSLAVPGGVQAHVTGLAAALRGLGHEVAVLAPEGRAISIPYKRLHSRGWPSGPAPTCGCGGGCGPGSFDVLHVRRAHRAQPGFRARNDRLGAMGSCTCSTSNEPARSHRRTRT